MRREGRVRGVFQHQTAAHPVGIHQVRGMLKAALRHVIGDALFEVSGRDQRIHRLVVSLRRRGREGGRR